MTNSITCVKDANVFGIGARIPATYSVSYDAFGKNPLIGAPTGTVEMLVAAGRRVVSEPDAAAAARLAHAYRQNVPVDEACRIFCRNAVAFRDLESMLETPEGRQRAWALFKKLPRLGK